MRLAVLTGSVIDRYCQTIPVSSNLMHITSFLVLVGLEATQMLCGSVSGLLCGSLCGLQNIVCGRLCGLQNIVSMKTHIHVN